MVDWKFPVVYFLVMNLQALGSTIKTLRKMRGLSVDGLAEAAGVHRNTVLTLESGDKDNVTISVLTRIAAPLNVTASVSSVA